MAELRPASRRAIARVVAAKLEHDQVVAEFEKLDLVTGQHHYQEILEDNYGDVGIPYQESEEAELKAMLDYFNDDQKLIPLAGNLLSRALGPVSPSDKRVKRVNRFLLGDHKAYDTEAKRIVDAVGHLKPERKLNAELDRRLAEIDEKYLEMHNGIWDAIASANRDKVRHASASSRELLDQVLREITSDMVAKKGEKIERKERVRHVFKSERNAELVNGIANVVEKIYAAGSKGVHAKSDYDTAVIVAKMTEYSLLFLLREKRGS